MHLLLEREHEEDTFTAGRLMVDGAFECWTMEDKVRPPGEKVYGQTAIPVGTYPVQITMSPRFGKRLPLLIGVPGFEGVRIHVGNTAADTEGCILVGTDYAAGRVLNSRVAMEALQAKMEAAQAAGDPIEIEIRPMFRAEQN